MKSYYFAALLSIAIMASSAAPILCAAEEVEEVEVREPHVPTSPTISSSVLTAEQIRQTTARNAGEALQYLPGVLVLHGTRRNHIRISIRGFNPRYVRVFIDGVPVNSASDESVDLSTIPVEIIERIEVIRGPAPVRYGANAMAGIILITTKRGDKNKGMIVGADAHTAEARDIYNQWIGNHLENAEPEHKYYNTFTYDSAAGGGDPRFNAFAAGHATRSDGWMPHSAYRNFSFWGHSCMSPLPWLQLGLTGGYFSGDQDLINPDRELMRIGGYGGGSGEGTGPMAHSANWEVHDWEKFHLGLMANAAMGPVNAYLLAFYYDDFYKLDVTKPNDLGVPSSTWRESDVYGLDAQFDLPWRVGKVDQGFGLGLSIRQEDFRWANSVSATQGVYQVGQTAWTQTWGGFLEYTIKPVPVLAVVAGARYDQRLAAGASISPEDVSLHAGEGVASPHLSFLWEISPRVSLHAAAARTYRFPKLRDTFDYVSGNPNLRPENAWDYELGLNYQPVSKLIIKTAAFRNDVKNLIYSPGKFIEFQNIGEARIWGFEFEADTEQTFNGPLRKIIYSANYTFMDAYDLTDNRPLPYAPPHKVDVSAIFVFPYDLLLSLQYGWVSERETDDLVTTELGAYNVMNAKISWRKKWGTIYAGVENLWNENYQETLGFPQPGRTFLVGTRLTF